MFVAGVCSREKTAIRFVKPGAKINSEYYIQHFLKPLFKNNIRKLFPGEQINKVVFHHDSAPAHSSGITQEWLQNSRIKFIPKEQWMGNSPDPAPMDVFWVNGRFKWKASSCQKAALMFVYVFTMLIVGKCAAIISHIRAGSSVARIVVFNRNLGRYSSIRRVKLGLAAGVERKQPKKQKQSGKKIDPKMAAAIVRRLTIVTTSHTIRSVARQFGLMHESPTINLRKEEINCYKKRKRNLIPIIHLRFRCISFLKQNMPYKMEPSTAIFYQDKAPCHAAASVRKILKEDFPCYITKAQMPPNSPDLNVLNYCA
ncbi:hypothetical protein BV898_16860 [Hypsibius exemplaris]|uniref:Tc1-like transposase DDE domain-containing protein n=1 Tax=Hypsibius exemplaris TaxID=2072580 RepID=A0A9X6NGN7_HYPEX|nr:hypothetical protein BV898_16860 [Hypsibius exemplaris]